MRVFPLTFLVAMGCSLVMSRPDVNVGLEAGSRGNQPGFYSSIANDVLNYVGLSEHDFKNVRNATDVLNKNSVLISLVSAALISGSSGAVGGVNKVPDNEKHEVDDPENNDLEHPYISVVGRDYVELKHKPYSKYEGEVINADLGEGEYGLVNNGLKTPKKATDGLNQIVNSLLTPVVNPDVKHDGVAINAGLGNAVSDVNDVVNKAAPNEKHEADDWENNDLENRYISVVGRDYVELKHKPYSRYEGEVIYADLDEGEDGLVNNGLKTLKKATDGLNQIVNSLLTPVVPASVGSAVSDVNDFVNKVKHGAEDLESKVDGLVNNGLKTPSFGIKS